MDALPHCHSFEIAAELRDKIRKLEEIKLI
jgi:protein-arginine kinase activator protein McsA